MCLHDASEFSHTLSRAHVQTHTHASFCGELALQSKRVDIVIGLRSVLFLEAYGDHKVSLNGDERGEGSATCLFDKNELFRKIE